MFMKSMKFFFTIGVILILASDLFSQSIEANSKRKHSLFSEVYLIRHDFSDGYISLNYEKKFGQNNNRLLRLGMYPDFETSISFPLVIGRILFPDSKHHLEIGFGGIVRFEWYERTIFTDIPALLVPLMYRFDNDKPLFFRAGINIIASFPTIISPSISIGWLFKRKEKNIYKDYIQI